jgi:hypothetical protein
MPAGSALIPPKSVSFGGARLSDLLHKDLEVDVIDGIHVVKGCYS